MTGMSATIAEPTTSIQTPPPKGVSANGTAPKSSLTNSVPTRRKLLSAADLAMMPTDLPSGTVRYELNDGVLVILPPPGDIHGVNQGNAYFYLRSEAQNRGLGEARAEVSIVLRRNPDRVVGADTAFILTASLPVRRTPEGYLETIPELVVEIRSKNDTNAEIVAKADEYFAAGVRVVWVIDPAARTLAAHRPDTSVQVFRNDDPVTCDLLPGFAVPAARFFDGT